MTGRRVPQGCVNNYIDILRQKMKASLSSALPEGGEKEICYVLNTGEYCAETIPQLEALIQKNIDEEYKEKSYDFNYLFYQVHRDQKTNTNKQDMYL